MAKLFVIKTREGERVPFLRGVLVQSLVRTGLPFNEAYTTAQRIRDRIGSREEIPAAELSSLVAETLEKRFGVELRLAYEANSGGNRQIMVHGPDGVAPFSVGELTRSLEAAAIKNRYAAIIAQRVREALFKGAYVEIDHQALRRLIYQTISEQYSPEAGDRYLSWLQFRESGQPLILLVGGVSGSGKSTITTELAYRLNVVRTQSTDMIREIIRCNCGESGATTLRYSSFDAWRGLQGLAPLTDSSPSDQQVIDGFLDQFSVIKPGIEATVARATKERQDLILDGVHVLPGEFELSGAMDAGIVVPIILVVTTKEKLSVQLAGRGQEQPGRRPKRYLQHMGEIWTIQSYLMSLAEREQIPVVCNWTVEDTVQEILQEVNRRVAERFTPDESVLDETDAS